MKNKIVMFILGIVVFSTAAFAQQGQKVTGAKANTTTVNPNIERMRVVNEKIAAEKASKTQGANQTNEQRVAEMNKRNAEIRMRENQTAGTHKTVAPVSKSTNR